LVGPVSDAPLGLEIGLGHDSGPGKVGSLGGKESCACKREREKKRWAVGTALKRTEIRSRTLSLTIDAVDAELELVKCALGSPLAPEIVPLLEQPTHKFHQVVLVPIVDEVVDRVAGVATLQDQESKVV
jgi:hypothetical protein